MKITRHLGSKVCLPYIAYIPEQCNAHPAIILQLREGTCQRNVALAIYLRLPFEMV